MFTLQGLDNLLDYLVKDDERDIHVHLFKNDITVDKNTELDDLTESDFDGYAAKDNTAWGAISNTGADEAASDGPEMVWEATDDIDPPQQAFGLYVTFLDAEDDRVLLLAANFDDPTTIAFDGDKVKKKLHWRFKNYAP